MSIKNIFDVIKGNPSSGVKTESAIHINSNEQKISNQELVQISIEKAVTSYIKEMGLRNSSEAKGRVDSVKKGINIDNRVFRKPEAKFQNTILKILYQKSSLLDEARISGLINTTIAKQLKGNSLNLQIETRSVVSGIESCYEAVKSLEKSLKAEYPRDNVLIMTNDNLDAEYEIDLLAGVENEEGFMKVLNLVQVKTDIEQTIERKEEDLQYTKTITKEDEAESLKKKHQEYLNALPQFIGTINKKESSKLAEKEIDETEIIDIDRQEKRGDQLALFGLVLDEYIKNTENPKKVTADNLYKLFKKEGGILNPFDIIGILKNTNVMDQLRHNKHFQGNKEVEKQLANTADNIPYTIEESKAYYEKNHVHSILKSAIFHSVLMEKGKVISEIKLNHPYADIEK